MTSVSTIYLCDLCNSNDISYVRFLRLLTREYAFHFEYSFANYVKSPFTIHFARTFKSDFSKESD